MRHLTIQQLPTSIPALGFPSLKFLVHSILFFIISIFLFFCFFSLTYRVYIMGIGIWMTYLGIGWFLCIILPFLFRFCRLMFWWRKLCFLQALFFFFFWLICRTVQSVQGEKRNQRIYLCAYVSWAEL
ncbi:hypothetical protein BDZ91DRAFT_560803 [Kalaharituber pfeilii]|nr:hypothetical protein BDZ91DRAFT_560803 [Kalaharituber pfeilii]